MKKYLFFIVFSSIFLSSCSSDNSAYSNGYDDGYKDGYEAGQEDKIFTQQTQSVTGKDSTKQLLIYLICTTFRNQ